MSALATGPSVPWVFAEWGECVRCRTLTSRRVLPLGGGDFECEKCHERQTAEVRARSAEAWDQTQERIAAEGRKRDIEVINSIAAFAQDHPTPKGTGRLQREVMRIARRRGRKQETFTLGCDEITAELAAEGIHVHPTNICHAAKALARRGVLEQVGQLPARDTWGFQGPGEKINHITGEVRTPGATGAKTWRLISKQRPIARTCGSSPSSSGGSGSSGREELFTYGVKHAGAISVLHRAEKLLEQALARARPGNRDWTCFRFGQYLKSIGLEQEEAERLALRYAEHNPPDASWRGEEQALKCIRSAFRRPLPAWMV